MTQQGTSNPGRETAFDAVVVGAGFAGLHMLYRLRELGLRVVVLETAPDVGGTWYWNRYPGARCDVESLFYSYSFSPELEAEWRWSERYAAQPEIHAYLQFVADRLDLRKDIRFETRVERALFQEDANSWTIETADGEKIDSRFCIMATGPISVPIMPDIPGIDEFQGELFHTARWPETNPSFAGKRVGVVGTGSSGTQVIPLVAEEAERLFVFLRTPNYNVPARNRALTDDTYEEWTQRREEIRAAQERGELSGSGDVLMPAELRITRSNPSTRYSPEERREIMERRFAFGGAAVQQCFNDVLKNDALNAEVGDFIRAQIHEIVEDPKVADILTPRIPIGAKRICLVSGYYETFNRDNVELVDVKADPIERITADGVVVAGREIPLDVIVAATGFDAVTGALTSIDIKGSNGLSLETAWQHGPSTLLGLAVAGFPNLFMIGGPGSPSVFTNVVHINEFQVDFIAELIRDMAEHGQRRVEARPDSQEAWTEHVDSLVNGTVLETSESWYVGANVPGKPRRILAYLGGPPRYRAACEASRASGYEGFTMATEPALQPPRLAV